MHGGVHVAAGHHRRERGAAIDSAGSAREPAGPAVGQRRLCPGAGRAAAAGSNSGRPAGPPPAVPGRRGHLHLRVAGVCAGPDRAGARAVPRAAGSRRRGAVRHRHAAAARGVLRCRPGPRAGCLRRHDRRRQRDRAAGRGVADRHARLAVHLLHQPAHRCGGVRGRSGAAARISRPGRRPGRLGGHGPDHRGADRADVRADPRQRAGLVEPGDRGPVRRPQRWPLPGS